MIYYRPTDCEVPWGPILWRPRTGFLMTQLGGSVPRAVVEVRGHVTDVLDRYGYKLIDADARTTGRDFLTYVADLLERNPLLSIDYLRRAYLLSGDKGCRARVSHIIEHAGIENRARTSVELLLAAF